MLSICISLPRGRTGLTEDGRDTFSALHPGVDPMSLHPRHAAV